MAVATIRLSETGELASAAAMAMTIFYMNASARAFDAELARWLERCTQACRRR